MFCLTTLILSLSISADPDWITLHGGRYTTDAAGRVVAVDLSATWTTDVDMSRIAQFAHLEKLDLSHTRITNVGLERLRGLRNVRELRLYYTENVTDSGLGHIADWSHLEILDLEGTQITSRALEHISRMHRLRSLDVSMAALDDDGFENLSPLLKLEHLAIGGNRLTGSCLTYLKLLPSLVDLDVSGMQRVDSGFWGLPLTDTNLQQIGALRQLRVLKLNGANLNDRGADRPGSPQAIRTELKDLSGLAGLVNLEVLDLSCTPVDTASLEPLTTLPKLQEIRLGMAVNIDDEAVPVLARMKELKKVYLEGTRISADAMEKIPAHNQD